MPDESQPLGELLDHGRQFLSQVEALAQKAARERDELHAAQRQWATERQSLIEEQQRIRELQEAVNETLAGLQTEYDRVEQERDRLARLHDQSQQEYRARLAEKETAVASERARTQQLGQELEAARQGQQASVAELKSMVEYRDRVQSAHESLQGEHRKLLDAAGHAATEHDQLKRLHDDSQRELNAGRERLSSAIEDVKRLEAQLHESAQLVEQKEAERRDLVAGHQAELAAVREQVATVSRQRDELQSQQGQWRSEREQLAQKLTAAESRQAEIQQEWQRSRAEMAEEKASLENQLADALAQTGEARTRLEKLAENEKVLREEHLKLGVRHAELTEQSSKLQTDWATRRQALSSEIHAQNQEMEQARAEIARARDRERQLLAQMEEARAQQPAALGAEQAHTLNSLLNTIIGFSTVLVDDGANAVTAEERREYLKHINDSAERLSDVLRRLSARTASAAPGRPEVVQPAGKGWKAPGILVADPDPQVRERIEPFLSRAGYDVVYVKNASELMQKAPSLQPLAILLDAQLPPDGASRLVRELRRDPRTREIPLVLTSAAEARQPGGNIGDVEFLAKPIDRQQLVQLMVKFDLMADGKRARKMPSSVLVVDDDRQTVSLVKAILKPFSIKVLTAENGKTAIEQALRNKPDLVLLDLVMPGVDGFEVVSALRREKETSQLPILVHTAKPLTKEERARLEGKVQCIIEKADLRQERLLELILKRGERRNRQAQRPAA